MYYPERGRELLFGYTYIAAISLRNVLPRKGTRTEIFCNFPSFRGSSLRNVLPRKGTRTHNSKPQPTNRNSVKKCNTPKGDENRSEKRSSDLSASYCIEVYYLER